MISIVCFAEEIILPRQLHLWRNCRTRCYVFVPLQLFVSKRLRNLRSLSNCHSLRFFWNWPPRCHAFVFYPNQRCWESAPRIVCQILCWICVCFMVIPKRKNWPDHLALWLFSTRKHSFPPLSMDFQTIFANFASSFFDTNDVSLEAYMMPLPWFSFRLGLFLQAWCTIRDDPKKLPLGQRIGCDGDTPIWTKHIAVCINSTNTKYFFGFFSLLPHFFKRGNTFTPSCDGNMDPSCWFVRTTCQ